MDNVLNILPGDSWQILLLSTLLLSTIASLLGMMALVLVRQPAGRSWVLLIALTACVVLPATHGTVRLAGWGISIPVSVATQRNQTESSEAVIGLSRGDANSENSIVQDQFIESSSHDLSATVALAPKTGNAGSMSANSTVSEPARDAATAGSISSSAIVKFLFNATGLVWLIASLILLLRLIGSAFSVSRLLGQAEPCTDENVLAAVSVASQKIGLAAIPHVLTSDQIATPMVLAFFRPTVLIPKSEKLNSQNHLITMLAHELAHIRRRDGWARLWVQLIAILLPLQPLVWWMRSSFFNAVEEACDDWAVAGGSDPTDLASVLTVWCQEAENQRELMLAVGMSATRSRVLRLLAMHESPAARLSMPWRMCVATAAFLICGSLAIAQPGVAPPVNQETEQNDDVQQQGQEKEDSPITISGSCVDENGKPQANAQVRLFWVTENNFVDTEKSLPVELNRVSCDAVGKFKFKEFNEPGGQPGYLEIVAQHPGRATTRTGFFTREKRELTDTEFKLRPAVTIKGRVVNESGDPVANALVSVDTTWLRPVPGIRTAVSQADGSFEISDIQSWDGSQTSVIEKGNMFVDSVNLGRGQVLHPDFPRQIFSVAKAPDILEVTVRPAATVEGQVTLKESGKPAVGARIELQNDRAVQPWIKVLTDENGRYRIENLPPGNCRLSIVFPERPNLMIPDLEVKSGANEQDFAMEIGGILKGRFVNAETGLPVRLGKGERMQIAEFTRQGVGYSGMPAADVQSDGSFSMRVQAGRRFFVTYLGGFGSKQSWVGVNTDQLHTAGLEIVEGETTEFDIRIKPKDKRPFRVPGRDEIQDLNLDQKDPVAAIKQLGGWVELETIDGKEHVVEVNMVYHEDEKLGRLENRLLSDECFSFMQKFPNLKRLLLLREQATDAGLAKLEGLENLEEIFIWDAFAVSDAGVAHLAKLRSLKHVHINNSLITDESLHHLSELPNVEVLSLQGHSFSDKGLEHLQGMKQLKRLWLGAGKKNGNEITDDGLEFLSGLSQLDQLELTFSKVTDEGLKSLRPLKNLRQLYVGYTKVTDEGFEELKESLPALTTNQ